MSDLVILPIDTFSVSDISPRTKQRLQLHVCNILSGSVHLPTLVAKGSPGPTLLAVAGIHGNEYEGMEAIRLIFEHLDVSQMEGTFIGVPVANPLAYEARTRTTPPHLDGLNLARIFPGDPSGSPSQQLAHQLLTLVVRNVTSDDLFIDFHSGSAEVAFAPLVGFRETSGPVQVRSELAARHFGLPRLWRMSDQLGPFNAETSRRGIPTIGTEITGRSGCASSDVAVFEQGLHNLLAFLNVMPNLTVPLPRNEPSQEAMEVLSPATGFLRGARDINDHVDEGDRLGTIITAHGETLTDIIAPASGTVWAARTMPAVRIGELLYVVAMESSESRPQSANQREGL